MVPVRKEARRRRNVPVMGIAFIREAMPETESIIRELGRVPVPSAGAGRLPRISGLSHTPLAPAFGRAFATVDFSGHYL